MKKERTIALALALLLMLSACTAAGPDEDVLASVTPTETTESGLPTDSPQLPEASTEASEPEKTEPATQPAETDPTDPIPTEPKPTEPKPTEPKPTEPKPTEPKPTEPKPTEPKPTEPPETEPENKNTLDCKEAMQAANAYGKNTYGWTVDSSLNAGNAGYFFAIVVLPSEGQSRLNNCAKGRMDRLYNIFMERDGRADGVSVNSSVVWDPDYEVYWVTLYYI